ncbi:hypothetical protein B0T14DRAFT_529335 [Immersiella caudata]|uniref:Uncharacterized protein n=1 Tax=Immersiella caudata TaxID=314043 RepID=A0AA39WCQ5_9PEZI|nr:hypothetical protein B0T14DRAFT_529335 [Immersiella caudata]
MDIYEFPGSDESDDQREIPDSQAAVKPKKAMRNYLGQRSFEASPKSAPRVQSPRSASPAAGGSGDYDEDPDNSGEEEDEPEKSANSFEDERDYSDDEGGSAEPLVDQEAGRERSRTLGEEAEAFQYGAESDEWEGSSQEGGSRSAASTDGAEDKAEERDDEEEATGSERGGVVGGLNTLSASQRAEFMVVNLDDDFMPDADDEDAVTGQGRQTRAAARQSMRNKSYGEAEMVRLPPGFAGASFARDLEKVPAMERRAGAWMREKRPEIPSLDEIKRMFPRRPLTDHWTATRRALATKSWSKGSERRGSLRVDGCPGLLALYKSCLRFMRCLPQELFSVKYNLKYDIRQNNYGRKVPSQGFCDTLKDLLVHPLWQNKPGRLTVAIQYAIIAETDDRQPWRPPTDAIQGRDSSFMLDLLNASQQEPEEALRELRQRISAGDEARGYTRSAFDYLFEEIERQVEEPPEPRAILPGHTQRYRVWHRHLQIVEKAVNVMTVVGGPANFSVELSSRLINNRRPTKSYPSKKQLKDLRDYEQLLEHEHLLFQRKVCGDPETEVESDDETVALYRVRRGRKRKGKRSALSPPTTRQAKRLKGAAVRMQSVDEVDLSDDALAGDDDPVPADGNEVEVPGTQHPTVSQIVLSGQTPKPTQQTRKVPETQAPTKELDLVASLISQMETWESCTQLTDITEISEPWNTCSRICTRH